MVQRSETNRNIFTLKTCSAVFMIVLQIISILSDTFGFIARIENMERGNEAGETEERTIVRVHFIEEDTNRPVDASVINRYGK